MNTQIFCFGLVFIALSYFFLDFVTPIAGDIGGIWRVDDILSSTFAAIGGGLVFAGVTTPAKKKKEMNRR